MMGVGPVAVQCALHFTFNMGVLGSFANQE